MTGIGGWPQRFVQICKCGAFLGPQWPIPSQSALRFAQAFYTNLEDGTTLGEAVRQARLSQVPESLSHTYANEPGRFDPSLLAYTLLGQPNAVVRFGQGISNPANEEERANRANAPSPSSETRRIPKRQDREDYSMNWHPNDLPPPSRSEERSDSATGRTSSEHLTASRNQFTSGKISGDFSGNRGAINIGGTMITGPPVEQRVEDEAHHFFESGREALLKGDFTRATHYFEQAERRKHRDGLDYLKALALLAGRRPRTLTISTVREIERLLLSALEAGEGSHAALALAYIKHDFHRSKGLAIKPPPIETLLDYTERCPPNRERLNELSRLTSIKSYLAKLPRMVVSPDGVA